MKKNFTGFFITCFLVVFMAGCGTWDGWSDKTAPTVNTMAPADAAANVAINTKIIINFSEAMDPLTITTATFTVTILDDTILVPGAVTCSGTTAVFTPDVNLDINTTYTVTITTGADDLTGNALAHAHTWNFTTGAVADNTAPEVTSTGAADGAINLPINRASTVMFSEAMNPLTISSTTFIVTGPGAAVIPGAVKYSGVTATFTPTQPFLANTLYTSTLTTGVEDLAGNPMASNYVWSWTTGDALDTTSPTVTSTGAADGAINLLINRASTAMFSEEMNPSSITSATFTVTAPGNTPVQGVVNYAGVTATFTPTHHFMANTLYTSTLTVGVEDLAGNPMDNTYTWSWTTGATPDTVLPTVISTNPMDIATGVATNKRIAATFSEEMNSLTITTSTFKLTGPGVTPVSGTVNYVGTTATFKPLSLLESNTTYTATINTGAKDLAGNALEFDYEWSFTTGEMASPPVALRSAEPFGAFGGNAGITNQGLLTIINGDIATTGESTKVTGFHDENGDIYTVTPLHDGTVNGSIFTAPPAPGGAAAGGTAVTEAVATQALFDAQTAYNNLTPAAIPGGADPNAGQLGGITLAPGIYQAAGGSFLLTGSDLTLDAQGEESAVWVFQMASSLTVGSPGAPRSIILTNGAQAKNVFWQVGSSATINAAGGGTMVGTILAYAGVEISTPGNMDIVTLNGRAIGLNASVTMVNTIINVPAP